MVSVDRMPEEHVIVLSWLDERRGRDPFHRLSFAMDEDLGWRVLLGEYTVAVTKMDARCLKKSSS